MRIAAVCMALALALACAGCLGGRADASSNGARADLLLGRSF